MGNKQSTLRWARRSHRIAVERRQLPREIETLLRVCDGKRSRSELAAECGLTLAVLDSALRKLEARGLVEQVDPLAAVGARSALAAWAAAPIRDRRPLLDGPLSSTPLQFSSDEEMFFAQSIDHLLDPEEVPDLDQLPRYVE